MSKPPTDARRRTNFVRWMAENDLNVSKVALASKVPATTIYTFVQGHTTSMSGQNQDLIAHAYNLSVTDIFGSGSPRKLAVMGSFTRDGVMRPYDHDGTSFAVPSWFAGGGAPVTVCRVGDMPFVPAEHDWLVLFKRARSKLGPSTAGWALVELAEGRRVFRKVIRTASGAVELMYLDGHREPGEDMVSAMPMVGISPNATVEGPTG
jgi:hypothetical protein